MPNDRSVRSLIALGEASTSRVLNLHQIANANRNDPEYSRRPLFASQCLNTAFIVKKRMRSNEEYLFGSSRTMVTKVIAPIDAQDLGAGGRSIMVDQRDFPEAIREFRLCNTDSLDRDIEVLRLLGALPSLDPFLLRQHLENHKIDVAPCYFTISQGDQAGMQKFVTAELQRLTMLLGGAESETSTQRMVSAMLSSDVAEELAPLRQTLNLTGKDFREGVFGWRGFLYYKWAMGQFWPDVIKVLREITEIRPHGQITSEQVAFFGSAKRSIIEMVRDSGKHIEKVLDVYDTSFQDLVCNQAPKTFREFLVNAPYMFLELGEKMGAISHIAGFWRQRFSGSTAPLLDAEELTAILSDFSSGFAEKLKAPVSVIPKPILIDARKIVT